ESGRYLQFTRPLLDFLGLSSFVINMDTASDKKPLLSSNSSRASGEGSNKDSKKDSKRDSRTNESKIDSKTESKKETPPVSGGGPLNDGQSTPHRIVRPMAQARPFSTRTKGLYWIFTILHLIILLAILFGISFSLLQFVFAQTTKGPLYWGTGSFIGGVPSIMYEPVKESPNGDPQRGKIIFDPDSDSSYKVYVDRLMEVMNGTLVDREFDDNNCTEHSNNAWSGERTEKYCLQNYTGYDVRKDAFRWMKPIRPYAIPKGTYL
ncbi:hypothetical protein PENTCL1PPCAC_18214, partial [Pristionchus entomophagus]